MPAGRRGGGGGPDPGPAGERLSFLLDECLSFRSGGLLRSAGHDALHVTDLGLRSAPDEKVLAAALAAGRVLLSDDLDFGELLRAGRLGAPSVVLFRGVARSDERIGLLLDALGGIGAALRAGSLVVLGPGRARVRPLPLG